MIGSFEYEYEFLSNFFPCEIKYNGLFYHSTEAAFQAQKTLDLKIRGQFTSLSASESKKLGRKVELRKDWDDVKLQIMEDLIRIKFSNPILKEKLIITGDNELVEGNYWHDYYWGRCYGKGLNNLGIILMKVREEIMNEC